MKYTITLLLVFTIHLVPGQNRELTTDSSIAIPPVKFDAKGALIVTASASSANNDFDFLAGKWKMYHRRLNKRLVNCHDWTEFVSWDENQPILSGKGNVDTYRTTEMPGMEGQAFEGFTLRTFDPKTRLWSLYWVASNVGVVDPPMVGSFDHAIGHFFCKDTYNGKPILVVFRWDARNKERPIWSQAFSTDNGKTWEWNWYNVSERVK